jgi:hypothetical protein
MIVFGQRQRIADEVDGSATERAEAPLDDDDMENDEDLEVAQAKRMSGPSQEAQDRFQDYCTYYCGRRRAEIAQYFTQPFLTPPTNKAKVQPKTRT